MNWKLLLIPILALLLLLPTNVQANTDEEEQFFGAWTGSLSPIVQTITGTDDDADVFHTKLLDAGAGFNSGLNYVKSKGTDLDFNHLAWDSMAYMWPYIRVAYPESSLPSWGEVIGALGEGSIDRDNFYDDFIIDFLGSDSEELKSVKGALERLYVWVNKEPIQDSTTIILIFIILIMSAIVSVNRSYEFNAPLFLVALSINITVAIWLRLVAFPFIVIPLLILGVLLFRRFGGGNE